MLSLADSFTVLAMIYYLFFSVNSLTYYALTTINQAFAVMYRLSEVYRMEEHQSTREENIIPGEPAIFIEHGEYAWGFRVSDNQEKMKKANKAKLEVQVIDEPVL